MEYCPLPEQTSDRLSRTSRKDKFTLGTTAGQDGRGVVSSDTKSIVGNSFKQTKPKLDSVRQGSQQEAKAEVEGTEGGRSETQSVTANQRRTGKQGKRGSLKPRPPVLEAVVGEEPPTKANAQEKRNSKDLKANRGATTEKTHRGKTIEVTLMTDAVVTTGEPEGKADPKEVKWELKGRSVDEILKALDTIKNDPTLPMPIIEVDPASVDDFQQYTERLEDEDLADAEDDLTEEEKDKESLDYLRSVTGQGFGDLRPPAFPADLWSYVLNSQKPLVSERWKGYDPSTLPQEIEKFLSEVKVSEERPYAYKYFLAQALANMDRFVVKDKDGIPPMIHEKFTHKMELMPGTRPKKALPQ